MQETAAAQHPNQFFWHQWAHQSQREEEDDVVARGSHRAMSPEHEIFLRIPPPEPCIPDGNRRTASADLPAASLLRPRGLRDGHQARGSGRGARLRARLVDVRPAHHDQS